MDNSKSAFFRRKKPQKQKKQTKLLIWKKLIPLQGAPFVTRERTFFWFETNWSKS